MSEFRLQSRAAIVPGLESVQAWRDWLEAPRLLAAGLSPTIQWYRDNLRVA